jgi:hypothetical protein
MASPSVTPRTTPVGFKMPDGFKTTYAFADNPAIQFWEMVVKPPTMDGGDAIPTSTMHNIAWRTMSPRHLKTLGESTVQAMYDPDFITGLEQLINFETSVTVHYPDGSAEAFWGFMQKAEFQELKEGEPPMVNLTIIPTNWDPVNFVEAGPVFVPSGGT